MTKKLSVNIRLCGILISSCMFVSFGHAPGIAGDFSNPIPYSGDSIRAAQDAAERMRLAFGSSGGSTGAGGSYTLGDYYERYQYGANWNNAVLSGNTIILNGDNNSVTLNNSGSTITQSSNGTCQSTTNTFLNSGGTTEMPATTCESDN